LEVAAWIGVTVVGHLLLLNLKEVGWRVGIIKRSWVSLQQLNIVAIVQSCYKTGIKIQGCSNAKLLSENASERVLLGIPEVTPCNFAFTTYC